MKGKSQFDVCGAAMTTHFLNARTSPCARQPKSPSHSLPTQYVSDQRRRLGPESIEIQLRPTRPRASRQARRAAPPRRG